MVRKLSSFKRLLYRAIKAGGIEEVDAGLVAGPKVLTLLSRLKMIESASGEPIFFLWSHEAIKTFELEKVCNEVYGVALKYCGYLNFEFHSGSGEVKWEKRVSN